MEIAEIYYKAKDGRIFTDPLKCEEYERTLGIIPGSVGFLISELEKLGPDMYIFGLAYVRKKNGQTTTYCRGTFCCDDLLESFVNVNDLTDEQRYFTGKANELAQTLKQEDKDDPVQYMIVFSDDINMKNVGIISLYNPKVWDNKQ